MKTFVQQDRCTRDDYLQLFTASGEPLRWLCSTLTGDQKLSDDVLETALEQSLKGATQVFREWMVSWARRQIVKVCIAKMHPARSSMAQRSCYLNQSDFGTVVSEQLDLVLSQPSEVLQQKLLELDLLPRFAFVLRALEGYSRRDTALLLNIDDRTCEGEYAEAMKEMGPNLSVMESTGPCMELLTAKEVASAWTLF